jgi:kynureninase
VDTILTIVSTLVEDQKDGPTAEKLRFNGPLKTDVDVPTVRNKQKALEKNEFFVGILKASGEKRRMRIRSPMEMERIRGSGSISKHHGS